MLEKNFIIEKWNADLYDQNVKETDADVKFLFSIVGKDKKRILEVCCGSGRILVQLAKAGHDVIGFDFDEFMLSRIETKAKDLSNIKWRKADAIKDDWGKGFDIVVLAGNILFNIVSEMEYIKAQELFIQKAAKALKPGGYVYIEYGCFANPKEIFEKPGEFIVWEGSDSEGNIGKMSLSNMTYDVKTSIAYFTRKFDILLSNGERIFKEIPSMKHYASLEQLHSWLDNAGFIIVNEFGDYEHNPISKNTNHAIIWAKKK